MKQKITQMTICGDDGLSDPNRIVVELVDEGDGEFVRLMQPENGGDISVTVDQWTELKRAIEYMLAETNKVAE